MNHPWIPWTGCLLVALQSIGGAGAADGPFAAGTWIDLTHDFSAETLYWPTAEPFALESEFHGQTPGGYFYAANRYRASEHGGTHIDAPVHFAEHGRTLDAGMDPVGNSLHHGPHPTFFGP